MSSLLQQETDDLSVDYIKGADRRLQAQAVSAFPYLAQDQVEQPKPEEEADDRSTMETIHDGLKDFQQGIAPENAIPQIYGGAADAVNETLQALDSLGNWLNENVADLRIENDLLPEVLNNPTKMQLPTPDEADTVTGGIINDVSQFITGFIGAGRLLRGIAPASKAGAVTKAAGQGAIADATVFDPHEERLSNLIEKYPNLQNPVSEYLQAKPDDSEAEGRLKNAAEGLGLGAAAEGFVLALKSLRLAKAGKATKATEPAVAEGAENFGDTAVPDEVRVDVDDIAEDAAPVSLVDIEDANNFVNSPSPEALRNHKPVDVISVPGNAYANMPLKDARKAALKSGLDPENGVRGSYHNIDTGWTLNVSRSTIEKSVADSVKAGKFRSRAELELISHIPDLIGKSVHVEARSSLKGSSTQSIHRFYAAANVGDEVYRVKLTAKESDATKRLYNIEAVEIEKRSVVHAGEGTSGRNLTSDPDQSSTIDIDTLLENVKRDTDGKPVLEDRGAANININISRIDAPDDVKEVISTVANQFGDQMDSASRGKISHKETAKLADDLGMTVEDLLDRRAGQAFNAEEALAARRILVSSGTQLAELAKAAKNGGPETLVEFRRALSVHNAIQAQVQGMTAEAGRALSQFRILAGTDDGISQQIKSMMDASGGEAASRDMAAVLADLADQPPGVFNKTVKDLDEVTTSDIVMEVWINGLLSGPKTHMANMLGNSVTALWSVPERALAARIGKLTGSQGVQAGEATAQLFGMVEGFKDGLKLAGKAFKTGEPSDMAGKIETARYRALTGENVGLKGPAGKAVDMLGEAVRLPGRALTAEDEFFKAISYRSELQALAFRQASSEGLEGAEFGARIADLIKQPTPAIQEQARAVSQVNTFTNELGDIGKKVQNLSNAHPVAKVILPFVRTPTNIIKYTFARTPLAFASKNIRADIAAGGARRDLALSRISLGSMTMATASSLSAAGYLTGGGPSDPDIKKAWLRQGWQPYSIKLGDQWYTYNRVEPLGNLLGMSADITEIAMHSDEFEMDELAVASVAAFSKNVTSKTYLRGLSDVLHALEDPDRYAGRYQQNLALSFMPNVFRQTKDAVDGVRRDTRELDWLDGLVTEAKGRVPGLSDSLPPRRDFWGDVIENPDGLAAFSPVRAKEFKPNIVDQEFIRLGWAPSNLTRRIRGVELKADEYSRYQQIFGKEVVIRGKNLQQSLQAMIKSSRYQAGTGGEDGTQKEMLERVIGFYRKSAQSKLFQEMPHLKAIWQAQQNSQYNRGN